MDTKLLMPLESGAIMGSSVTDVQTGAKGTPGELHGKFNLDRDLGTLYANTDCGVFGVTDGADDRFTGDPVPVAKAGEVKVGAATILSMWRATRWSPLTWRSCASTAAPGRTAAP